MNKEALASALFDLYDVRNALSTRMKNKPKDDCSDITIGECLDDAILFLEQLEEAV